MKKLKTILLAEDNPRDIELTLEALSEHNLANYVQVVHDGVEMMDFLHCEGDYSNREPSNPLVILLDIKMPRKNGIDVLRELRDDPDLKTIPVVMLTSSRETPDLLACYELGVNAYVVKPVEFTDFVYVIRQLGIFWALINEPPLI
jgi:CheY-like chemotaxis protein